MLDHLSERLQNALNWVWEDDNLNEANIETALKEVRRALLEADVNLKALRAFLSQVQDRAIGEAIVKSVDPGQQFIKIVHDELTHLLGSEASPLDLSGQPNIIMLFGLQGAGKTTTAAKLALHINRHPDTPRRVLLVAADVYRPAAIEQLCRLGERVGVPVFHKPGETDVSRIVRDALASDLASRAETIIVDTAGRLHADTSLMAELLLLEREFIPQERLLVIDAMTGQEAVSVALAFNTQISLTGLVLAKLDGDSRGGAALSVVHVTGKPIKFVGVSEQPEGLEVFHPDRLASRMLGMGDVVSLVEKAQQAMDESTTLKLHDKMRENRFGFDDYIKLQKQLKMLGPLEGILGMLPIPGITAENRRSIAKHSQTHTARLEVIVSSMTPTERRKPELLNPSRTRRIAAGCGLPIEEVNGMVEQFMGMRQMMQQLMQLMDGFGSGGGLEGLFGSLFGNDDD